MRAIVTTPSGNSHALSDAEQFERIECLLSRRPTIGEVRNALRFMPSRVRAQVRPLLEAHGYGESLS